MKLLSNAVWFELQLQLQWSRKQLEQMQQRIAKLTEAVAYKNGTALSLSVTPDQPQPPHEAARGWFDARPTGDKQ